MAVWWGQGLPIDVQEATIREEFKLFDDDAFYLDSAFWVGVSGVYTFSRSFC